MILHASHCDWMLKTTPTFKDNISGLGRGSCHFNEERGRMNTYVQLVRAYALHMESVLNEAIKTLCYGCLVNHPSQTQHDVCLMMSGDEQVHHCFQKCLGLVNEKDVMETFTKSLEISEILRCPSHLYSLRFRQYLWLRDDWVDDVSREMIKIRGNQN